MACDVAKYIEELIASGHTTTEFITFPMGAPLKPVQHLMTILPEARLISSIILYH